MKSIRKNMKGFTLVELLTVIAIIGILAGLTSVVVASARRRAYITKAQGEVRELVKAWNVYWLTFGKWPEGFKDKNLEMDEGNMSHLRGNNGMKMYFIDVKITDGAFRDPWGRPYKVDFTQTTTPGTDIYEACVALPLQKRYKYD